MVVKWRCARELSTELVSLAAGPIVPLSYWGPTFLPSFFSPLLSSFLVYLFWDGVWLSSPGWLQTCSNPLACQGVLSYRSKLLSMVLCVSTLTIPAESLNSHCPKTLNYLVGDAGLCPNIWPCVSNKIQDTSLPLMSWRRLTSLPITAWSVPVCDLWTLTALTKQNHKDMVGSHWCCGSFWTSIFH